MAAIAVTGHRPEKLVLPEREIMNRTQHALHNLGANLVYQGIAAGYDLLAARAAWELGIPFVACLPWRGWNGRKDWRARHVWALKNAFEIVEFDTGMKYPGPHIFQVRNEYMIDKSDQLLAFWDGTPGGTHNAIGYAESKNVFVSYIETT